LAARLLSNLLKRVALQTAELKAHVGKDEDAVVEIVGAERMPVAFPACLYFYDQGTLSITYRVTSFDAHSWFDKKHLRNLLFLSVHIGHQIVDGLTSRTLRRRVKMGRWSCASSGEGVQSMNQCIWGLHDN